MSTCISRTVTTAFIFFVMLAAGAKSKLNEISFSVGAIPVPYIITDAPTTFNVSYMHVLNDYVSVGGTAGYTHAELSSHDDFEKKTTGHVINIMPSIRAYWFKGSGCRLYSSASIGCQMQFRKTVTDKDTYCSVHASYPHNHELYATEHDVRILSAFHLSPIGIELGSKSVKAFAELGIGTQGLGQAGIRVRF